MGERVLMKKGCMTGLVLVVVLAAILAFAWPQLSQGVLKVLYPQRYTDLVEQEAAQFDLDPGLVYAVIKTESGFDPEARSHADAMGLMQLTQGTFD